MSYFIKLICNKKKHGFSLGLAEAICSDTKVKYFTIKKSKSGGTGSSEQICLKAN